MWGTLYVCKAQVNESELTSGDQLRFRIRWPDRWLVYSNSLSTFSIVVLNLTYRYKMTLVQLCIRLLKCPMLKLNCFAEAPQNEQDPVESDAWLEIMADDLGMTLDALCPYVSCVCSYSCPRDLGKGTKHLRYLIMISICRFDSKQSRACHG